MALFNPPSCLTRSKFTPFNISYNSRDVSAGISGPANSFFLTFPNRFGIDVTTLEDKWETKLRMWPQKNCCVSVSHPRGFSISFDSPDKTQRIKVCDNRLQIMIDRVQFDNYMASLNLDITKDSVFQMYFRKDGITTGCAVWATDRDDGMPLNTFSLRIERDMISTNSFLSFHRTSLAAWCLGNALSFRPSPRLKVGVFSVLGPWTYFNVGGYLKLRPTRNLLTRLWGRVAWEEEGLKEVLAASAEWTVNDKSKVIASVIEDTIELALEKRVEANLVIKSGVLLHQAQNLGVTVNFVRE